MKKLCTGFIALFMLISVCFADSDISIYMNDSRLDTETLGCFEGADYNISLSDNNITIMKDGVLGISKLLKCKEGERVFAIFTSPLVYIGNDSISFNLFPSNYEDGSIRKLGYIFQYKQAKDGEYKLEISPICLLKKDDSYSFTALKDDDSVIAIGQPKLWLPYDFNLQIQIFCLYISTAAVYKPLHPSY